MAAFIVTLLCVLALVSSVSAQLTVGGASSAVKFATDCVGKYNQAPAAGTRLSYASVGSGAGKSNFVSYSYLIGYSDDPMTTIEDNLFAAAACGSGSTYTTCPHRYTIPLALATFNFFYNKGTPKCAMTASFTLSLFKKGAWGGKCGLSGSARSFVRDGSSGTTFVVTSYWSKFVGSITPTQNVLPFGSAKVNGNAMCGTIGANVLSIGYSQVGNCYGVRNVNQAALQNKAGSYTFYSPTAGGWDVNSCVSTQYPATATASFAAVGGDMVGQVGRLAPAMCAFLWTFSRGVSKQRSTVAARVNYAFLSTSTVYGSGRLGLYLYSKLPANAVAKNQAALSALRA